MVVLFKLILVIQLLLDLRRLSFVYEMVAARFYDAENVHDRLAGLHHWFLSLQGSLVFPRRGSI